MSQPDATRQLEKICKRVLQINEASDQKEKQFSKLVEVLTERFVWLVGNVPGWWGWRGGEGTDDGSSSARGGGGRLDEDVRLRRYAKMWCRFILILAPAADLNRPELRPASSHESPTGSHGAMDEEEGAPLSRTKPAPVDVVCAIVCGIELAPALKPRFRKLERLGKAAKLVELVTAMIAWVSSVPPATKGRDVHEAYEECECLCSHDCS